MGVDLEIKELETLYHNIKKDLPVDEADWWGRRVIELLRQRGELWHSIEQAQKELDNCRKELYQVSQELEE